MGLGASQARLLHLTARLSDLELEGQQISNTKIRLANAASDASEEYQEALNLSYLTVLNSEDSTYVPATAYNLTTYQAVSNLDKQRILKTSTGKVLVNNAINNAYATFISGFPPLTDVFKGAILDGIAGYEDRFSAVGFSTEITAFLGRCGAQTNPNASDFDQSKISHYLNVLKEIITSGGCYTPEDQSNLNDSSWLSQQLSSGNLFLYTDDNGDGEFENVSYSSGDSTLVQKTDETHIARAEAEYESTMAEIEAKEEKLDLHLKTIDTEHNAIQTEMESVQKVMNKNIERTFKIFDA